MSEWSKLESVVDQFAIRMKSRLTIKVNEGYHGWDDPKQVTDGELRLSIHDDTLREGKEIDIACRAMFIWFRREFGNKM